jgi:hypothetical protein
VPGAEALRTVPVLGGGRPVGAVEGFIEGFTGAAGPAGRGATSEGFTAGTGPVGRGAASDAATGNGERDR